MNSFYASTFAFEYPLDGGRASHSAASSHDSWPRSSVGAPVNPPCDLALMKKVAHHEHIMQEIESQWNLPVPWSNSIGVDPKVIFGQAPSAPLYDEDDIENHPPTPKRRKTKASENDDIDVAFPPADYYVAPPDPPVPSTSTSPQPATQKSRGKRPRAASDSEDSLYTAPSESDDRAIPGLRHVRCRWGGCNQLIERVDWQEHMDSAHRLRSVQCAARGRWYCQFTGCASDTASHASMVRHLRTKHFVKRVHVCDTCGDVFSRSDSRNRHVENKSCVEGRAKRR